MKGIGIHFAMPDPDWLNLSPACDGKVHQPPIMQLMHVVLRGVLASNWIRMDGRFALNWADLMAAT
jgi:hypothetical protein